MAGKNHLIKKLAALVATFNDADWIALANKGLLRRARKDLEKGISISPDETAENNLPIQVGDVIVTLPESGPGKATCSCPAPGICQHILTACLFLKQSIPSRTEDDRKSEILQENQVQADPLAQIENELLAISHEQLRKWAGTADFKTAIKLAVQEESPLIEAGNPFMIKLSSIGVACRYPAGTGLEGFIANVPAKKRKQSIIAAILVFQKLRGIALPEALIRKTIRQDESGAPRSRQEVLSSIQHLLENSVTIGLAHLSSGVRERFATLAVSAQGVKLQRLSLALRIISDDIGLLLEHSAQADMERLFLNMTRLYALNEALKNSGATPGTDLAGWSKSQYHEIARVHLMGVGAYPWRTPSGYRGLTVLFWENKSQNFFSWTDARPEQHSSDFDPLSRYTAEIPWQGGQSPKELSRSTFSLLQGSKNPYNRLSASSQTQVIKTGSTRLQNIEFGERLFTDWQKLLEYAQSLTPIGLTRLNPLQEVVFVKPAMWGDRFFDEVEQRFSWWLADKNSLLLPLSLEYSQLHESAIQALEHMQIPQDDSVVLVARIIRHDAVFFLLPYSILTPAEVSDSVWNIMLDSQTTKTPQHKGEKIQASLGPQSKQQDWDGIEEKKASDDFSLFGNILDQHISEVEEQLLTLAERGSNTQTKLSFQFLEKKITIFQDCGLSLLAQAIQRCLESPEAVSQHLLSLSYLLLLHRQAAQVQNTL